MVFCKFMELDTRSTAVPALGPRFEKGVDSGSVCTPTSHVLVVTALLSDTVPSDVRNWSNKSEASLAVI